MFKNARKVHIDGQAYFYTICQPAKKMKAGKWVGSERQGKVGIHTPQGKNLFPTWSEVTGLTEDEIVHGKHHCVICSGPCDFEDGKCMSLEPSVIKKYIEEHIHGT